VERLDWLIIGGGIHGVHLAARLLGEAGVEADAVRIVDPGQQLLERWRHCTETTGMTHLRSPSVHHLDLNPWSLQLRARQSSDRDLFAAPNDRPALRFFNDHCDEVIEIFGLADLHVRARAVSCSIQGDGVNVDLSSGEQFVSDKVVLALGASDQPEWPEWAPRNQARVQHVFSKGFDSWPTARETVAVVGGGISSAQVALRLIDEGHQVHMVSRHALRQHQFDSDKGWLGPKYMNDFSRERDVDRRRMLITEARHRGSVPPEVNRPLRRAIKSGDLDWHESGVDVLEPHADGIVMGLVTGESIQVDRVLLATGFATLRPGGELVDQLITSESLACAKCGYPVVDQALSWHPRVYVSGPLAELELGPTSRNIHGARRAGDRIVKVASAELAARATHVGMMQCSVASK